MSKKLQRYRHNQTIRDLVSETTVSTNDLIMPIFVHETLTEKREIASLPGLYQWSLNDVLDEVNEIVALGIKAVILFGIPENKDAAGSSASLESGVIQETIRKIKAAHPKLIVIADCCLCEYTDHGNCGVLNGNTFNTNATLTRLNEIAVSYARAGVDIVAPSGMMDGMVRSIRTALDNDNFHGVSIMSYSSKFASSLYGPFRDAAGSSEFCGDRKHHQLNPSQRKEALRESIIDEQEGADYLMVKPVMFYLDICRDIAEQSQLPLAAYQVSGEYAMLKQAAASGMADEYDLFHESLLSIKRAGVSLIITYYAKDFARVGV